MFPLLPFLFGSAIVGGCGGLAWYETLSPKQREEANQKASKLAMELFSKGLNGLNAAQVAAVWNKVRESY